MNEKICGAPWSDDDWRLSCEGPVGHSHRFHFAQTVNIALPFEVIWLFEDGSLGRLEAGGAFSEVKCGRESAREG